MKAMATLILWLKCICEECGQILIIDIIIDIIPVDKAS